MGFSITGYVLEPPRVGQANSPFTITPNDFISDSVAFNAAYPSSEANPRNDYLVTVITEGGPPGSGLLVNATLGWSKNEIVQRFDYASRDGRFRTLPGSVPSIAGTLSATSNLQRLKVTPPFQVLAAAPFRLSLGNVGSGLTQTVSLVFNDGAFGSPPPGTTELSLATGNLNWNTSDLTTFVGQTVRWQQQQFFGVDKSTGRVGLANDSVVLLTPIPGTGQFPLLRFGYGLYLTTVEVANEGAFSAPPSGTVQWALTTGRLHFNASDVAAHTGIPVYYDGVLFATGLSLPRQSNGTVNTPTPIVGLPPPGGDIIVALPSAIPYYQFPQVSLVSSFDSVGKSGVVEVDATSGAMQFSLADRATYGSQAVQVVFGDLAIDHGVSLRLFRTPVNLDASQAGVKDVTAIYSVQNAIWASPIIGSPQVFIPSVPIDDVAFPMTVSVVQSQGTFTGVLNRLDTPSPPAGMGYFIDFDTRTFHYAQRKTQVLVPILTLAGTASLPDPLVLSGNLVLELETAGGTGVYTPLTLGVDALFDSTAGLVSFTSTQGISLATGSSASFSGTTFTDTTADFTVAGVQPGDLLLLESTPAKGAYTITAVPNSTTLSTDVVAQTPSLTGPSTPVSVTNASYIVEHGREVLADRFFQEVVLVDPSTSVERLRALGSALNATIITPGSATFSDFITLTDLGTDFLVLGVQIGDTVVLSSGPDVGSSRSITFVTQHQVTVSSITPFISVTAATYSIVRRLHIPVSATTSSRIRFGTALSGVFSQQFNVVADDAAFTSPGSLPAGTVEVSQLTGNLNFSSLVIGQLVYWVHKLTPKVDYQLSPGLGLVQFSDRMLSLEEVLVTYTTAPPSTDPPTPPGPPVTEYATFIVRKEVTQDHPIPTSTLHFNPLGRPVATNPPQAVFRGGRPQQVGVQCTVDTTTSTITFLPDSQITDALPHGAVIAPNERVYIDYYVLAAVGGEKTTTVLQPPLLTAQVNIQQGVNNFVVHGDQTSSFPSGSLMRIEAQEIYLIGSSTYLSGPNQTTVTLAGTQLFQDTFSDPTVYVTSGPTPVTSAPLNPAYFTPELQGFDPVARGMNKALVVGDRTSSYLAGTVVEFTDLSTFTDFLAVTGSKYDSDTNKTEVTFAANTIRQYMHGQHVLLYSVRPIFEAGITQVQTSKLPILTQPFTVYRRTVGSAGVLLIQPTDYTVDDTGVVKFASVLQPAEEFSMLYTGHRILAPGPNLRATYTCTIVPNQTNGLLSQVLQANYFVYSPDSFYFRVETLTNFKGEVIQEIQAAAQSGAPSSGPMTSNSSTPQLFQQGRESVYFQEEHLANDDLIARACLKFFNDAINHLEDALHALDGRVVGDQSGHFKFDGSITNPVRLNVAAVTNQIDDRLLVSPFPLPSGTTQPIYVPGPFSRFFSTRRNLFTSSPALGGSDDGDVIAAFSFKNLSSLPADAFKRWPRAQIQHTYPAGTTTFVVDNATGTSDALQRPAFINQMRVIIQDAAGTVYVTDGTHSVVTGTSMGPPQTISISIGPSMPVPAGATIYLAPSDANTMLSDGSDPPPSPGSSGAYAMLYPFGKDLDANLGTGELLYIKRKFPFDGTLPTTFIPKFFYIFPVQTGDILQVNGAGLFNTDIAPYKFPALYGGTTDDDGDQAVPIVGPTFDGELTPAGGGPLNVELLAEQPSTGTWRTATTEPYVGTGSLDVTKTIITDASLSFPAPVPQIHDLVRILSGANGVTAFRRITAVVGNTITVDSPFVAQDVGFSYTIAVSSSPVTGTSTLSGTILTDLSASFTTDGVQVGHTVVMVTGPNAALRRQVASITDNTHLVLSAAFPSGTGGTYRVDNPLDTYGGTGSVVDSVLAALATELATISTGPNSEQAALTAFFSTVFTTILSSANGVVPISNLSHLTDSSVNFISSGVNTSHFVYILTGPEAGVYPIASVDSATQITVGVAFPSASVGNSYQIVSQFGSSLATFTDIFSLLTANTTFVSVSQAFQTLISTQVQVLLSSAPDPTAFALGLLPSDLDGRATTVQNRLTFLTDPSSGPIAKITKALTGSDRFYDKRYTWIDARINQQSGYLAKEVLAASNRVKAQQDVFNQLIKLLTVQEA